MTQVNDVDMENLRHTLGIGPHIKKRQWGYRNHFAPGGTDIQSMERLEEAGLVRKGRVYEDTHYYHATEVGCIAAGLKPYQTRKAMESWDDEQVIELADDLTMLASRIREAGRGECALPNPWNIDDWLSRYRWLYQGDDDYIARPEAGKE
jgi:hypothetical protein